MGYTFPDELKALYRETDGDNWFLLSLQQIIDNVEINRKILSKYLEPDEYSEKVDRYIFFATNGCGDYYCYRVSESGVTDTSAIYIWEHEGFEARYVAKDIKDAIIKYYNDEI
ncbi:MAG: SMI1/KNR4 family protein [Firmicutes bacterium]|nr:SMI1/KNR4 family protein [Bacillota bacterium]